MKGNGKITVIPTSGLANRLRVIAASVKLSRESGKDLIIYWYRNFELNADFESLFEDPVKIIIKRIPLKYKLWISMTKYSKKIFGFDKWFLRQFKFDFIFRDSMATLIWHNKMNIQQEINQAKNILICSCQEINYFDQEDYRLFIPQPAIRHIIDTITTHFKPGTIGIHIRSTDNATSIENSPFYLFQEKIREELLINPGATFFLATDNEDYQNQLVHQFGAERIMFYKKEFRREKEQGIKDAVVDMYCLSKTSKIYGSYFSSFSEVAARIGKIPVYVIKKESLSHN